MTNITIWGDDLSLAVYAQADVEASDNVKEYATEITHAIFAEVRKLAEKSHASARNPRYWPLSTERLVREIGDATYQGHPTLAPPVNWDGSNMGGRFVRMFERKPYPVVLATLH